MISEAVAPRASQRPADPASRLQARYRRLRDAIGTGEIGLHFAIGKPLKGFCALMRCESSGTAEAHATGFSTGSAVAGTGEDQLAFEFGQPGKNSHHQAAMRAGRVACARALRASMAMNIVPLPSRPAARRLAAIADDLAARLSLLVSRRRDPLPSGIDIAG